MHGLPVALRFSSWKDHDDYTTGYLADPRSFCIQKTLQDIAHGGDPRTKSDVRGPCRVQFQDRSLLFEQLHPDGEATRRPDFDGGLIARCPGELPAYTDAHIKAALLAAGASGTIYSLVMPESEAALAAVVDDRRRHFDMYREPWSQKQDDMHVAYFDTWTRWSRPVVDFPAELFPFRYPTAGASEGIFKLMAEYLATSRRAGFDPSIHIFDGEYEGFPAYAASLGMAVVRHERQNWRAVPSALPEGAMFWISQPSAIDGMVRDDFPGFIDRMAADRPEVPVIPT